MSDLTKFLIKAYVRKALAVLGTILISHDVIAPGTADSFALTHLDEIVGWLMLVGSAIWTAIYQWYVKRKVKKALELEAGATPKQLERALEKEVPIVP